MEFKKNYEVYELQIDYAKTITIKYAGSYNVWLNDTEIKEHFSTLKDAQEFGLKLANLIKFGG